MPQATQLATAAGIAERYATVRQRSEGLIADLAPEDLVVQSCYEVSPLKWHLAHTTWFFEHFILAEFLPRYAVFHPAFHGLFNSYYTSQGELFDKNFRGAVSRPTVAEVLAYRAHVDAAMARLLQQNDSPAWAPRLVLGLAHEEQHQELMLMDLRHIFFCNPLKPAAFAGTVPPPTAPTALEFIGFAGGLLEFGHLPENGFAYDNEGPCHRAYVAPFEIANRLVTNAEFLAFMEAGGYDDPRWWHSDGWAKRQAENWQHPLYWNLRPEGWTEFSLYGEHPLNPTAPVGNVSWYEADAYARWCGNRLPTEYEWELAAKPLKVQGNFLNPARLGPLPATGHYMLEQMYGALWQWTESAYRPYPGYVATFDGTSEYNGKFMQNQMVLRGGCWATPPGHTRLTYRNFFYPHNRWQCAGIRLARSVPQPVMQTSTKLENFTFIDLQPELGDIRQDVLKGLTAHPKALPPKLLYDATGAELFTQIVTQPEYYPPTVEQEIMADIAPELAQALPGRLRVLEPGAGDCRKFQRLYQALPTVEAFVSLEISAEQVETEGKRLAEAYPALEVMAVCVDYTQAFELPAAAQGGGLRNLVFFPGSSIGNYEPAQALAVLKLFRAWAGPDGALLIGVDLHKDTPTLEAAYNDAAGITAAFNLNLIARLRDELGLALNPEDFRHRAHYNPEQRRIEMHLYAQRAFQVDVLGQPVAFEKGESIHTESSYKYTVERFKEMGFAAGFTRHHAWTDPQQCFSLHLLQ